MLKQKAASADMWFGELFQVGIYKRSQGRVTRQATFAALAIAFAVASYSFYTTFGASMSKYWTYGVCAGILVLGTWISFRLVNMPRFADFLIAVEAEMNKVSWPSRAELTKSSVVVIFVIFSLSSILFGFDVIWGTVFEWSWIAAAALVVSLPGAWFLWMYLQEKKS
jgi:preprotein translocase subunit SecE